MLEICCKGCGVSLDEENRAGRYLYCKPCRNARTRSQYQPGDRPTYARHRLSKQDYEQLVSRFDGLCHVCKAVPGKFIDHDHSCCEGIFSCGECVRGFVCLNCNSLLGFAKDDVDVLSAAIEYLA
jgi:hypothetical protein